MAAFLDHGYHLHWCHSSRKQLGAAHINPPSGKGLSGEHPVLSAVTWFTCMFGSPNFREVSLKVLISVLLLVSWIFFLWMQADMVLPSPCHFSMKIKKCEQSFFVGISSWGYEEIHILASQKWPKMRRQSQVCFLSSWWQVRIDSSERKGQQGPLKCFIVFIFGQKNRNGLQHLRGKKACR